MNLKIVVSTKVVYQLYWITRISF